MYRKVERLAAAVMLMTNHVSPDEPLRRDARSVASSLLSNAIACRDELRAPASRANIDFQAHIRHLISLVRLMVFGGFVSGQNADVVSEAADELGLFLVSAARSSLSESIVLKKDDIVGVPDIYKGQKDIRDKYRIKDKTVVRDMHDASLTGVSGASQTSSSGDINVRADTIMGILRSGGELNIRDIAAHMPEYGEKTIQRGLNDLIRLGLVKRLGLKRWSRYSLA